MKTAFNIPPANVEKNTLHLLVETGVYGISYTWFTKGPVALKGISVYNFSGNSFEKDIKASLHEQGSLLDGLASVTICFDFKESVLIPDKFTNSQINEQSLYLLYGEDQHAVKLNDHITAAGIVNQYRVEEKLKKIIDQFFPNATVFHSTSLQLENMSNSTNLLRCIFFHNSIKVILYNEGQLMLVQQFFYSNPDDVAYHLLNVCEQNGVSPSIIPLVLSGMIDEQSKLYTSIYNYFLHLSFDSPEENNFATAGLKELPAHYFSHIISLASCV